MDSSENYKILKSFSGMAAPKAGMIMYPQSVNNPNYDYYDHNDYFTYNSAKPGENYTFLDNNKYLEKDNDGATYIATMDPQTPEDAPQRAIVSGPMSTTLPYVVNGNKVSLNNRAFENHENNIKTVIPVGNDAIWENIKHREVKSGPMGTIIPAYARPQNIQTSKQVSKPKTQSSSKPHYVPTWVDRDNEINARYAKMQATENQQEQPAQVVQPTEPAPVTNTRKPVQKSTGFTYMPMSTDQAVELYRKQRYNF